MALSDRFKSRLGGGIERQRYGDPAMRNAARQRDMGPAQGDPGRPADMTDRGTMTTGPVMRQFGPQHGNMNAPPNSENDLETKIDPRTGIDRPAGPNVRQRLSGRRLGSQMDEPRGIW